MLRSAFCVAMLVTCLMALKCTADAADAENLTATLNTHVETSDTEESSTNSGSGGSSQEGYSGNKKTAKLEEGAQQQEQKDRTTDNTHNGPEEQQKVLPATNDNNATINKENSEQNILSASSSTEQSETLQEKEKEPEQKDETTREDKVAVPEISITSIVIQSDANDIKKTPEKPKEPTIGDSTVIANGQPTSEMTSKKETPSVPGDNNLPQPQPPSHTSGGNNELSKDKTTPKEKIVTLTEDIQHTKTPNTYYSKNEKSQSPELTQASRKNKRAAKSTTTPMTEKTSTEKNTLDPEKSSPTTTAVAHDKAIHTAIKTGDKETIPPKASVTSITESPKEESTLPATSLPKLSSAMQSLDKMDSSIGSSSLFAFAALVTFVVIAASPAI